MKILINGYLEYSFNIWSPKGGESELRLYENGLWLDSIPKFTTEMLNELSERDLIDILHGYFQS